MWSGIWSVVTTRTGLLNLNLVYEILWTGAGNGLLISMLEKLIWFRLTSVITLVLFMWKWMGLFFRNKCLLRCWGCLFLLNWIQSLRLSLLLKQPSRKLEPWSVLWSFFLLSLLCISIILPYGLAWNTLVIPSLVLLAATWNCWISYTKSLFPLTARFWNYLPIEWFRLTKI